ncbi:hypothetical protein [Actinoplanes sp. ATCC 53533]|uniref:hypothetical protein n=1 Tax=Actinoplanes sp. ATCC 53533 TaxID=1288362 RepID=UPI0013158726|nr:hypothetical protein [Actinoplanes sp. ATCC 53533]
MDQLAELVPVVDFRELPAVAVEKCLDTGVEEAFTASLAAFRQAHQRALKRR